MAHADQTSLFAISPEWRRESQYVCSSMIGTGFTFMPKAAGRATLQYLHYIAARLFWDPQLGQNMLRPCLHLLVRRFGPSVIPSEAAPLAGDYSAAAP